MHGNLFSIQCSTVWGRKNFYGFSRKSQIDSEIFVTCYSVNRQIRNPQHGSRTAFPSRPTPKKTFSTVLWTQPIETHMQYSPCMQKSICRHFNGEVLLPQFLTCSRGTIYSIRIDFQIPEHILCKINFLSKWNNEYKGKRRFCDNLCLTMTKWKINLMKGENIAVHL